MLQRLDADPRQILVPLSEQRKVAPSIGRAASESKVYVASALASKSSCDVLFELGVEEMPPAFQQAAQQEIEAKAGAFFASLAETFASSTAFVKTLSECRWEVAVSSRRLALIVTASPCFEPDRVHEVWGPAERIAKKPDGALSPAGEGFLRKNAIEPGTAKFREKEGGAFLYAEKLLAGRDLPTLLAERFKSWVESLGAPLMMRWLPESVSKPFIRPVRWIVALADDAVVPLSLFGLTSGRVSTGLRILTPKPLPLAHAKDYEALLGEAGVRLSWADRRAFLVEEGARLSSSVNGRVKDDDGLFDKCAGLTESPHPFLGAFDSKYLRLPGPLVASVLREHMNSFALETADGSLLPYYVGVAGYRCGDVPSMVKGTQDVVVGRLEDGAFYYDGDLATPLTELREKLKAQLFQADMGSLWDKSERVGALAKVIASKVTFSLTRTDDLTNDAFVEAAVLAGMSCKSDLRTGCVQEFPDEMQGIMAGILVRHQKSFGALSEPVARAITEHYEPKSAQARLPSTALGHVVALADKLDSLCLMMNQGAELKGNKDPFGLRRLAIGILRLLGMEEGDATLIPLTLDEGLRLGLDALVASGRDVKLETFEKMRVFLLGRLKASWRGTYNPSAVEAATASTAGMTLARARLLVKTTAAALQQTGEGSLLEALAPYRRSRNLTVDLPAAEASALTVDAALFSHESERALFQRLSDAESRVQGLLAMDDFERYFSELSALGKPLAAFFEGVMVLDKDPRTRANRLALLLRMRKLYESVADFSLVQV